MKRIRQLRGFLFLTSCICLVIFPRLAFADMIGDPVLATDKTAVGGITAIGIAIALIAVAAVIFLSVIVIKNSKNRAKLK